MSKYDMKVVNANTIELQLTVTMPLSQWRELKSQMGDKWPSWDFARAIGDMIRQAEKHFYPEQKQ